MDSLNGSFGPENVSMIAAADGLTESKFAALTRTRCPDQFEIRVTEMRPAKPGDDVRVRAEKAYAQGLQLYQGDQADAKSGIPILQQALRIFKTIGDVHGQAAALYGLAAIYQRLGTNNEDAQKEFDDSIKCSAQADSKREEAEVIESWPASSAIKA